jgi:hypothetical protein
MVRRGVAVVRSKLLAANSTILPSDLEPMTIALLPNRTED